jgi:hypothetical protein
VGAGSAFFKLIYNPIIKYMKKLPLFVLLFFSFGSLSFAQDRVPVPDKSVIPQWQTIALVEPGRIDAIASLGQGVILAGSRNPNPGYMFRSTDKGATWQRLGQITQVGITCILGGTGSDAYLLTERSELWASRDSGLTWKQLATLSGGKNTEGFALSYGLWLTEQGTILATDANSAGGHIYRSVDRGHTWSDLGKISDRALYRFNRVGNGIIVNGWDGTVYKSLDDGLTWRPIKVSSEPLYATEYLGAGVLLQASQGGVVYKGTLHGDKWETVGTPGDAADDFVNLGQGVVLYTTYTGAKRIFISRDNGSSWKSMGTTETVADDWLDHVIAVHTANEVIVVGGTRKGFIIRAVVQKDFLYRASLTNEIAEIADHASSSLQMQQALVSYTFDEKELDEPEDILIDGNLAFIPCRDGHNLAVYDVTDPKKPLLISSFRDPELIDAMGVAKNGNILYLTSLTNHTLLVLDVKNPRQIKKLSSVVVGGEGPGTDRLRKVAYQNGYAYLTHSSEGKLYIADVRDPKKPKISSSVETGDGAFGVFLKGDYAIVGGCFKGSSVVVIDVSDKKQPTVKKILKDDVNYACTCDFRVQNDLLFAVAYASNSFITFDISKPEEIVQVGIVRDAQLLGPGRLVLRGNEAYTINSTNDTFGVIDISDPRKPRIKHLIHDRRIEKVYGIDLKENYLYLAGRDAKSLVVLDLDQLEPSEKGITSFLKDTVAINAPEDVVVHNNLAYMPCRDGGTLTVVDISDGKQPKVISVFKDSDLAEAMGLDIWQNYLFLTSMSNRTLLILDISNPKHIQKISSLAIGGEGKTRDRLRKVKFHEGYLYVTHSNEGKLYVVDINNIKEPKVVGSVATGDGAFNLHIKGNYAYVGGCYPGRTLKVINIEDPLRPFLVQTMTNGDTYECLCSYSSKGNYLFAIAFHGFALAVFDISNPLKVREIAVLQDPRLAGANRMHLDGTSVFVASAWRDSMVEIDVTDPLKPGIKRVVSSHLLNKAYGITSTKDHILVVGRDADSLVLIER